MRAIIQRVSEASVTVDGEVAGSIGRGLLVFVAVKEGDTNQEAEQLAAKITRLRIFPDEQGKMNLSLQDIGGALLIVSQFTLYAETRKGNRPSYSQAAPAVAASKLYRYFIEVCRELGLPVTTGVFQAQMQVRLTNDGPVTLICDFDA